MSENVAFQVLAGLAAASRKAARGLPAQTAKAPRWSGVGFSLLGQRFVSPMSQVAELMEVPASTRLPGVQTWVVGLSNVRGRLLPLFDLAQYFGESLRAHKKYHRVLVLETDTLYSGIVVDSSYGMQHFTTDQFGDCYIALPEGLAPYIEGSYHGGPGDEWPVFSLAKLAEDTRFSNAALV